MQCQKKHLTKTYIKNGQKYRITAHMRFDDDCKNGHNTFAITADIDRASGKGWIDDAGGCLHDDIALHFPELQPYIKWHLTSTDGPMHYVANALYWLGYQGWCKGGPNDPPNLEHARSSAVWSDMPESFVAPWSATQNAFTKSEREALAEPVKQALLNRRESLLVEFRQAMESLGFVWTLEPIHA